MADTDFERIQPASLDELSAAPAPGMPSNPEIPAAREARPVNAATLAIALLAVVALLVVFALPRFVGNAPAPEGPPAQAATAGPAPGAAPARATAAPGAQAAAQGGVTPWEQAQRERARAEAKTALDALLALQYELQQRGVERWAATEFGAVTALAREGDEAYRAERFEEAAAAWREGGKQLGALKDGIADRLGARLAEGEAAIVAGDAQTATRALGEALAIEPGNARATAGLERAGKLDRLAALVADGRAKEAAGDGAGAQASYREALALDAGWQPARDALAALESRLAGEQAAARVSAGYAALAAGRIDEARREFQAAIRLGAGTAAREGLQQADFQSSQQRIGALLAKARDAEAAEDWKAALSAAEAALAVDATLAPARESQQRARARLALDTALAKITADPEALLSEESRAAADKLLAAARGVGEPGPRLRMQIAGAEAQLARMRTRVPVTLHSDGNTDVTVFRVGSLGSFDERRVELLPGDYVAAGTREGYRDVRVPFAVRPGTATAPVSVQCRQRI
jgi:hypothetical protein